MAASLLEPRWPQIGPHGFFDLIRLARRGRSTLVRICYILALFAALAGVYYNETHNSTQIRRLSDVVVENSINTNARIAERFSFTILIMQNLAVLVLMPIYVAASVHEERDKRTLPLLFTTHLTAREIVRGKWLARVGHVGSILLGGLPVLSFVQLWGGIDMPMIAANFANTAAWLVSVAAFSMMMATQSRTMLRSVVKTYVLIFAMLAFITCCALPPMFWLEQVFLLRPVAEVGNGYAAMGVLTVLFAGFHLVLTLFFLWRAEVNLEAQRGDDPMPLEVFDADLEVPDKGPRRETRAIPDDALAWRERLTGHLMPFVLPLVLVFNFLPIFMVSLSGLTAEWGRQEHSLAVQGLLSLFVTIMLLSAGIYIFLATVRLTGCIVRERSQDTLESLFLLPIDRREILYAKVRGCLLCYWTWLVPFGIAWTTLMLLSVWNPWGGILLLLALGIHLAFFAMVGLFLSVLCRTVLTAYVIFAVVLLEVLFGTFILAEFTGPFEWHWNPVGSWIAIANGVWRDGEATLPVPILGPLVEYALAALVCGLLASWRFWRRD